VGAELPQVLMGLGQILATGVFPFVKVRDRVEAEAVYTQTEPEITDFLHGIVYRRIIKVQVWLM